MTLSFHHHLNRRIPTQQRIDWDLAVTLEGRGSFLVEVHRTVVTGTPVRACDGVWLTLYLFLHELWGPTHIKCIVLLKVEVLR
jgi:hypothetical protein